MIQFLKTLLGIGPKVDLGALISSGAVVVDVRTKAEYQSGHLKNALNIPLDSLPNQLSKLSKDNVIITCCASGMRSSAAKNILKSNGFTQVYNGGPWTSLRKYF